MVFEPQSGFLRRVCFGQNEILRGIYMAVRDRNWCTVPGRIEQLNTNIQWDAFQLEFDVDCRERQIHFRWHGQVTGSSDGTLRYVFNGEALSTFLKNRIGLCLLHPLRECCGAPARYKQADGQEIECRFPATIEPQIVGQGTFRDLRSMAHQVYPGCWAELEFEGDLFETEDQRNWTDASFKTYSTPLAMPFPVEIKSGTRLHQAITLRLKCAGKVTSETAAPRPSELTGLSAGEGQQCSRLRLNVPREPEGAMPPLGLTAAGHGIPLSLEAVNRVSMLQLGHLRVDLWLAHTEWPQALARALTEAKQLGVALELAVHLGPERSESALEACGAEVRKSGVRVARGLAFRQCEPATSLTTLQIVRRHLGVSGVPIGGGSDSHFCELNREQALGHFGLAEVDFISWPMTPQVHAFDDLSVMENLEAQPHTVATARAFAGNKPLVVSPITLRPRFNAVASGEESRDPAQLPPQVDPRHLSLFNAAWTLGSIAVLARAQARSLTYFETTGASGLMETRPPSLRHPAFPSVPGMIFPVYSIFAALAGFSRMAPGPQIDAPRDVLASLCLFDSRGQRRLLCANLTMSDLQLVLELGAERTCVRTLQVNDRSCDSENADLTWSTAAQLDCPSGSLQLALPPYGIVSMDSV